ncbi:MAG: outer membrane beta-barrel protein [Candidatus Delongbacteria bacterium]|nr:outer membrane beta-barrel protein [Candidatus Delongbacteria bacterium]
MKKQLVLIAALILDNINIFAQIQKGNFLLVAGTSLESSLVSTESYDRDKVETSSFKFTPRVGYFLASNVVVGLDFLISNTNEKEDGNEYKSNTYAIGPFTRLYFGKDKIKFFLHAGLGFGKNTSEHYSSYAGSYDNKVKSNLKTHEFGGGISIFLLPKIALEVGILHGNASLKNTNHDNEDTTGKVKGIASSIGFSIHL